MSPLHCPSNLRLKEALSCLRLPSYGGKAADRLIGGRENGQQNSVARRQAAIALGLKVVAAYDSFEEARRRATKARAELNCRLG